MNQDHPLTKADHNFLTAMTDIRQNPDDRELAFTMRELVHCTLPHRDPVDVPGWRRQNGNLFLGIRPGWDPDTNKNIGIPYGSIPRLLLFWLTTEAVRNKSRRIELGRSYSDFVEKVGLSVDTGRGARGDATRLRNQMTRLFCASFRFQQNQHANGAAGVTWLGLGCPLPANFGGTPDPDQLAIQQLGPVGSISTPPPGPRSWTSGPQSLKHHPRLGIYVWTTYVLIAARSGKFIRSQDRGAPGGVDGTHRYPSCFY